MIYMFDKRNTNLPHKTAGNSTSPIRSITKSISPASSFRQLSRQEVDERQVIAQKRLQENSRKFWKPDCWSARCKRFVWFSAQTKDKLTGSGKKGTNGWIYGLKLFIT
jgi:hypothetical protein